MNRVRSILISGAALLTLLMPLPASATSFSKIYVFGDSLSDTGNVFNLTGAPPAPYADGRFSNGEIWIDSLAQDLGLEPVPYTEIDPSRASSIEGINFAFGGATTGTDNTGLSSLVGLQQQVDRFANLIPAGQTADANALFIVWAGANDYLGDHVTDASVPVANLSRAIDRLTELGARHILVANLPNLGLLPATRDTARSEALANLTNAHNAQLAQLVETRDQSLSPNVNLTILDVNGLFNQALAGTYGFTNITDACFDRSTGTVCADPNRYLFWDGIHPTTAAHQRVEAAALAVLQPSAETTQVPPSVPLIGLGVLALGILGAGSIARRRRKPS